MDNNHEFWQTVFEERNQRLANERRFAAPSCGEPVSDTTWAAFNKWWNENCTGSLRTVTLEQLGKMPVLGK